MKTIVSIILALALHSSFAQNADPLFPAVGKFNVGFISTYTGNPPPVAIVDVTYGISKKFSLGIVGGTTGELALMGLRINTALYQKENFRIQLRWNGIYYPERNGTFLFDKSIKHVMPWMFTMGIVDAEWKKSKGTRWTVGIGYLETHCIDGMLKLMRLRNDDGEADLDFELYNVVHGGVSIPLSKKLFIRPEVIVVMKGFEFAPKNDESKVSPLNPFLNFVYVF